MSIGAELGQYILQTQFRENSEDSLGDSLNAPCRYSGGLT